jgi:hypothetical protein
MQSFVLKMDHKLGDAKKVRKEILNVSAETLRAHNYQLNKAQFQKYAENVKESK